jgi:hypothetical protein
MADARLVLRWLVLAAAVIAGAIAIATQRTSLAAALDRLALGPVLVSAVFAVLATIFTMLAWRALLTDLGSPLGWAAAARIFLLSQLGKYLPG